MINAEIIPENEHLVFVRFSDPNEEFGNKSFFAVTSIREAEKRMYSRNKQYITNTLLSWLNQRAHALPKSAKHINQLIIWTKSASEHDFNYVVDFVYLRASNFECIAPATDSTCRKYYDETINPILIFCTENHKHIENIQR